jgi:phosphoenolpyruvate carboxykinase (GTP)
MALAEIFSRPEMIRSDAPSRPFGAQPEVEGPGMDALVAWVDEIAALTKPDAVHWVGGSRAENDALLRQMVDEGKIIKLNPEWRPGSSLARSPTSACRSPTARTRSPPSAS